jgi:hypothetical protein
MSELDVIVGEGAGGKQWCMVGDDGVGDPVTGMDVRYRPRQLWITWEFYCG